MFKSRRSSHLVLMKDDRDRLGRRVSGSGKSPVVNETKPYAGEGGMKKLLARRKQEEEEDTVSEDATPRASQPSPLPPDFIPVPPVPSKSDWFSTASGSSTSGSSLRVGRAKTSRNHIQRPSKTRFSAVYEEEPDDIMDDNENRQKERQMLEEAAKKVPVFTIPPDFSFAKDVPPVKPAETETAKEPPIASLPFTFSKSATPTNQAQAPAAAPAQNAALEVPPPPARVPTPEPKAAAPASPAFLLAPAPAPPSTGGIPNFFANSQVLANVKGTPPVPPPVLDFGTSKTASPTPFPFSTAPPSTPSQPVNDNENPFWDGGKTKLTEETKPVQPLFSGFGKSLASEPVANPVSIFGAATSAFPPLPKPDVAPPKMSAPAQPAFSFTKPAVEITPLSDFGGVSSSEPLKLPFSFGTPAEVKKPELAAPKPLFGTNVTTASAFGEASKSAPSLFEEPPKPASPFGASAPPQPTPSPLPFSFGAPQSSASAGSSSSQPSFFASPSGASTIIEAPKPLFGGSTGFSFGQPPPADKEKDVKAAPFSFGGPPSTPPVASATTESKPAPFSFGSAASTSATSPATEPFSFGNTSSTSATSPTPESKPAPFSFGQASTAAPAPATNPVAFSFSGGGSTTADVSNKPPFMFGQPTTVAPTDRPVTPPKNYDQEFRMEESPTRDLQQMNGNKTSATLNGAFSFGAGNSSSGGGIFGGQTSSSQPSSAAFGFGAPPASNPFAQKDKAPESKGFGGFGQPSNGVPTITTSFSFGQQAKSPEDPQRPSTAGPFSFNGAPSSATSPAPAFSFGGTTNAFGQPSAGSAPSSPSTFNQSTPFSFGAPAPSTNASFGFGSQPNSPASSGNLSLPQPAGGFANGGGFGQPQQPSSPFSGPIALAPSTSGGAPGGNLFTIGAAPAAAATGGPRQIKKLPNRRGGVKR
ncbi:hypothetical protein GALMADRAFT_206917 [Galerina marginata CBS 339.88]|uniref:Uncharacterized protein n=1 Tax=Galerina marginata (strain CBS 339.88) TaxID=685588 RepID=A0A067TDU3_GALM3|nr:hypothetical protein GALMADRAFT_206917 [Galerina marginata CBS 339.88]